jgi:hypothetical protein
MRPTVKVWRQHFDGFESDLVVRPDAVNPLDASSPAVLGRRNRIGAGGPGANR